MKTTYDELKNHKNIVIWGTGRIMERYYSMLDPALDIAAFCDTFPGKWSKNFRDGYSCFSKDELTKNHTVLIAIENLDDIKAVSAELDAKGIAYCHIYEAAKGYLPEIDKKTLVRYGKPSGHTYAEKVMKYIDCAVPYNSCNLKCNYCYIRQHGDFRNNELLLHTPEFIRCALSKDRLGGRALINFCGAGETMLCKELIPIIRELLEEGHYISIVTNGTVTGAFDEMRSCGLDLSRVFIKFSFHYLELKRLRLLERYARNVNDMWDAGCSVSVELVPDDILIPFIPEIKEFSMENFGAYPHCTVPRDETVQTLDVLTKLPLEDYRSVWGQFDSAMFDYKMETINQKRFEDCKAGLYAFHMNLESGDAYMCIGDNPWLDNLYEDLARPIPFKAIGHKCRLPYCYNCHSYQALGLIEELTAPTYYQVRDRETVDGRHWISDTIKNIFVQRLYENNRGLQRR